jgi:ATP-dependent DNA ligase
MASDGWFINGGIGRGKAVQRGAALPGWIKPQLTKLVDQPPDGPEWLHELKYDGYRMHARLDRGAVRLLTRTPAAASNDIGRCRGSRQRNLLLDRGEDLPK